MVEPNEKSTDAVREIVYRNSRETVILDSRLALFGENRSWLALGDLHYGYEVSRRADGGLWPMWGRETVEQRVAELVADYRPELLILNGDVVDSAAAAGTAASAWLDRLQETCGRLVLIKGNHDRGPILRDREFLRFFRVGDFLFHHGHLDMSQEFTPRTIEVIGHHHPAIRFSDGAGLSLKLPALVQEPERWILPAFSPWAGGCRMTPGTNARSWACSRKRILGPGDAD